MLLKDNSLYVIYQGCHTDWFIPINNRCEGLRWKTIMLTWARNKDIKVKISKRLIVSQHSRLITRFPEEHMKRMISDVKFTLK